MIVLKRQEINEYTVKPIAYEAKTMATKAYEKAEVSKNYERVLGVCKTSFSGYVGFYKH